jgi:hypothetical protein
VDSKAQAKELFQDFLTAAKGNRGIAPGDLPEATAILEADPGVQVQFVLLAIQNAGLGGVMRFGFETVKWMQSAVSTILRRTPDMADADVIALAKSMDSSLMSFISITGVVGYIERRCQKTAMSADVRLALSDWADTLHQADSVDQRKACQRLRTLVGIDPAQLFTPDDSTILPEPDELTEAELNNASDLVARFTSAAVTDYHSFCALGQPAGREIRDSSERSRAAVLLTIVSGRIPLDPANAPVWWLMRELLAQRLPYSTSDFTKLLDDLQQQFIIEFADDTPYEMIRDHIGSYGLSPALRTTLLSLRDRLGACCYHPAIRPHVGTINGFLGHDRVGLFEPGDPWADAALADYQSFDATEQSAWKAIFAHAAKLESSQPTRAWTKEAAGLLQSIGGNRYLDRVERWFPHVAQSRWIIFDKNSQLLKGLVWFCGAISDDRDASTTSRVDSIISRLAFDCFAKIRGCGQRCAKAGNACVAVLGSRPGLTGVSHLNRLRQRITYQVPLKLIEKALNETANRAGLTQDDLVEFGVPTFGLDIDGRREEEIGEYIAVIDIKSGCDWRWFDSARNPLASAPALTDEPAKEFSAVKKETAELEQTLADQKVRLENLYLAGREWPMSIWRERYLEHPLVGQFARRLIWEAETSTGTASFMPDGKGALISATGESVDVPEEAIVRLWHPLGQPEASIAAWCERIGRLKITQPFKQAHRETYLPNADESEAFDRPAGSQRFASHILRQHQFQKLAQLRGWRYRLQGGWDSANTPYRELPRWGLTASFDVGSDEDAERTSANIDITVTTGEVKFGKALKEPSPELQRIANYAQQDARAPRIAPERVMKYLASRFVEFRIDPVALRDVPLIVFSEIMRDVDLFVSACSIGNAPNVDEYSDDPLRSGYWRQFSFGEPTGTVKSRAAILNRLLRSMPALSQCAIDGRYLLIEGRIRRYRIHLGSGAIFMEPGSTALVIKKSKLASREQIPAEDRLYLPFEGDELLFDILNHALLLVHDDEIADPGLRKQIGKSPRR